MLYGEDTADGRTVKYSFGEAATVVYAPGQDPQYTDTVLDKAAIALFTSKVASAAGTLQRILPPHVASCRHTPRPLDPVSLV